MFANEKSLSVRVVFRRKLYREQNDFQKLFSIQNPYRISLELTLLKNYESNRTFK